MYAGKIGRDHLGLGSVSSDQILPLLSPGINVLTIYPRYHSFYCFLLDEFWRRDRMRNMTSWVQFYRPREFIFSVGVFLCDQPEHATWIAAVGKRRTSGLAKQRLSTYDTRTDMSELRPRESTKRVEALLACILLTVRPPAP